MNKGSEDTMLVVEIDGASFEGPASFWRREWHNDKGAIAAIEQAQAHGRASAELPRGTLTLVRSDLYHAAKGKQAAG